MLNTFNINTQISVKEARYQKEMQDQGLERNTYTGNPYLFLRVHIGVFIFPQKLHGNYK